MIRIITTKRLRELEGREFDLIKLAESIRGEQGLTLNCGAKSCQFQAKNERGLAIHRAKAHR